MGKSTKKKNKKITAPKANIQELSISRDGGQIALRGYSYQFLYSCYLILSSSNPSNFFQLEGIEDIDCIMQKNGSNDITHIQLKYSVNKQDASFLTDVLKNFLEAYLLDQNRFFKLVYDFPVAKGHLSKIFASKLDEKSRTYWAGVISNIKKNNPSWNWSVYDFDKFISHLSFEKIEKSILATEIEKTLIRIYEINTDNVSLFANSIKILCFEKMEQRAYVTKAELDSKIQSVKIDISKGPQNPAHSWIRKLDYSKPSGKTLGGLAGEVDKLREDFALITTGEKRYPKEDRPFEEKATVPERLGKIKNKYFQSIQNFMNQFAGFLAKEEQKQRLAMVNLITAQSSLVTMQNYFAEIAIDFGFQERQMVLCVMETQNIERLIMCCRYYQAHSPNKYFDKYQIRNWYDGYCRDERKIAEEGFLALKSKYLIHFPDKIYTIDMLRYYPIIVDNFDMASESNLTEWLLGCIAFSDAPFDYLVILSANEFEEINSAALQFPRQMLVDVKKAIESENYSSLDKLLHPYPVDVTAQMLDCFSEKYDLPEKKVTDVDEFPIGDIAEELWIYSKSVELLTEPEDACYLADQTQDIQPNIAEMLRLLKNKLPFKDVDWLIEICDNVFSGEKFDDIMFNNVIEHFIQKKIEQ